MIRLIAWQQHGLWASTDQLGVFQFVPEASHSGAIEAVNNCKSSAIYGVNGLRIIISQQSLPNRLGVAVVTLMIPAIQLDFYL